MDVWLPPEITSPLIYTGPGSASLIEAAAAWAQTAQELDQFASAHAEVVSALSSVWVGASDAAMRARSALIVIWAQLTAGQAAQMSSSAAGAATAFEAVHAAITPPPVVFENRVQLATLIATNVLGQNFPAIALNEAQYAQMWAANIAALIDYQATSTQATGALAAFQPPAAFGQNFLSELNIFAPGSNTETAGLAGLLNLFSGASGSAFGSYINSNAFATGLINTPFSSGFFTPANALGPFTGFMMGQSSADTGGDTITTIMNSRGEPQFMIRHPAATRVVPPAAAQLGVGTPIGGLTTPPSWTAKAPAEAQPRPVSTSQTTMTMNMVNNAAPLVDANGVPLPLPIGGLRGGTPPKVEKPPPEYGQTPTVTPKHPYGG